MKDNQGRNLRATGSRMPFEGLGGDLRAWASVCAAAVNLPPPEVQRKIPFADCRLLSGWNVPLVPQDLAQEKPPALRFGLLEEAIGSVFLNDLPLIHEQYAIGHLAGKAHLMSDH